MVAADDSAGGVVPEGWPSEAARKAAGAAGVDASAAPATGATLASVGLDSRYYSDPGANKFRVRGKNYLADKYTFSSACAVCSKRVS